MQAVDAGHAIDRLREIAAAGPGEDAGALKEVQTILSRMDNGVGGYLSEKIAATKGSFETWLSVRKWEKYGSDPQAFRAILMLDIAKLGKAIARGSEGQD